MAPLYFVMFSAIVLPITNAVQFYSDLPVHGETYVRHNYARIRRSLPPNSENPFQEDHPSIPIVDDIDSGNDDTFTMPGDEYKGPDSLPDHGEASLDLVFPDEEKFDNLKPEFDFDLDLDIPQEFEFPEKMVFSFLVNGKKIHLNLKLNKEQLTHTPVRLIKHGRVVTYNDTSKRDYAFYQLQNGDDTASMMVRCKDHQYPCYLIGSFTYDGVEYAVEPTTHTPTVKSRTLHNVYKLPTDTREDNSHDTEVISLDTLGRIKHESVSGRPEDRWKRDTGEQVNYQIELQMVIDYSVYQYWLTRLDNDVRAAIDVIKTYYEQVANSMDLIFSTATTSTMSIDIIPLEIDIITTESDQPWINDNYVSGGTMVNIGDALDDFQSWVAAQTFDKQFDAIMTFSREEMASVYGGSVSKGTAGIARLYSYGETVSIPCLSSEDSVSIVEDRRHNSVSRIAAHELAHNLGVRHDQSVGCDDDDSFIMAASSGSVVTLAKAGNPWTFSACSIAVMERTLTRNYDDPDVPRCLSEESSHDASEYARIQGASRLGEEYSLDQQCELRQGEGSRACAFTDYPLDESICYNGLACSPTHGMCNTGAILSVMSGSPCAANKWCDQGRCVDKPTRTTRTTGSTTTSRSPPTTTRRAPPTTTTRSTKATPTTTMTNATRRTTTAREPPTTTINDTTTTTTTVSSTTPTLTSTTSSTTVTTPTTTVTTPMTTVTTPTTTVTTPMTTTTATTTVSSTTPTLTSTITTTVVTTPSTTETTPMTTTTTPTTTRTTMTTTTSKCTKGTTTHRPIVQCFHHL